MSEQQTIIQIQKLYAAYIRSKCDKARVFEHLADEYNATLVAKALRGYIVKMTQE